MSGSIRMKRYPGSLTERSEKAQKTLYGEVENKHYLELTDATWDERVAVICLIFCVAGLGTFPFWVSNMISPAAGSILQSIGVM